MQLKKLQTFVVFFILLTLYSCNSLLDPLPDLPSGDQKQVHYTTADEFIEGQFIVAFNSDNLVVLPGINPEQVILNLIELLKEELGIEESAILYRYAHSFKGFAAKLDDEQVQKLKEDERIAYIEQDRTVSLITPIPLPGLTDPVIGNTEQNTPYGITRVGGPFDGTGFTAWVIDTGVDSGHNDLNVDRERSRSFVFLEPVADDLNGHGTHVAGTIAAIDNDIDVVGVAAGASIVSVKVLNALGIGTNSGVIAGIDYVAEHAEAGEVANLSLGGGPSDALDDAVREAASQGILFAIAAGNDSEHSRNYSPARVEHENTWTVSAVDENDVFASFSNYGNPPIRYAAPGVGIESLWINNSTHTISGTSMAAPHVAGILLISNGNPVSDGTAIDDPYGTPDPIVFFSHD